MVVSGGSIGRIELNKSPASNHATDNNDDISQLEKWIIEEANLNRDDSD